MDYNYIDYAVLEVYKKYNVYSFPINCFEILELCGKKVKKYSEQKPTKKAKCLLYSEDAFKLKNTIYYNDNKPLGRTRFSLAHELGHIILEHTNSDLEIQEKEADVFASHILAPRMAIHYSGCKNQNEVSKLFQLSQEAAQYAFDDYRRWHRRIVIHKMNSLDMAMYNHFFNDKANCFVYRITSCTYCGTKIYNTDNHVCLECISPNHNSICNNEPSIDFRIAESHWLYGGL